MSSNTDPSKKIDLSPKNIGRQKQTPGKNPKDNKEKTELISINIHNEKINNHIESKDNIKEVIKEINSQEIKNEISMEENKELNDENNIDDYELNLKNKLKELKDNSNNELRGQCEEYYLVDRNWMIKLNEYIKGDSSIQLDQLMNNKNNDEFLLEKEKINRALSLNYDKNNMIILKPKYAFCSSFKPCPVNKTFWEFLKNNFGLEPEIKEYSERLELDDGKIMYKRDYCKYVKINCIILPKKRQYLNDINSYIYDFNNINSHWPLPSNYIDELIHDIQSFYFFIRKNYTIKDLMDIIEKIVRKYPDIKLVEKNNYKCWIDLI